MPLASRARQAVLEHRNDVIAAGAIVIAAFFISLIAASRVDPAAFERRNFDIYLQGDLPRAFVQMATRFSNGGRTGLHPLFSLIVHPPTAIIHSMFGVSWPDAVRAVVALIAAGWTLALFLCVRLLGIRGIDATLLAAVGFAGAAARFWLVVPETFAIGGIAILIAVAVAARADAHKRSDLPYVAAGVATFGSTLTNWSTGLLLALTSGNLARAVRISLQAVGAAALLWIGQKLFFPNVVFIFDPMGVRQYVHALTVGRIVDVTQGFFSHAAVAPQIETCRNVNIPETPFLLTFQGSAVFSGGVLGVVATILWLVMLAVGAYALFFSKRTPGARFVLGGSLAFQYALHLLYGGESFLYSVHWWGLLVLLVALGLRTRIEWAVRLLAIAFVFTAGVHNWYVWEAALPAFQNGVTGYPVNNRTCDF